MSVIVHNIISANTSIQFKYLETTHLFGLEVNGTYRCSIDDLEYEEGQRLLNNTEAFEAIRKVYTKKHIRAKIGADIFHSGIITNISRSEQDIVNSNEITISIKEFKRVSDDQELSELSGIIPLAHKLENFNENFSFSRTGSDISYTRTVSIKYAEDISDQFLNNAYLFLKNAYLANRPVTVFGYQTDGLSEKATYDKQFRPRISENYDLVNKSVTLSENFKASNVQEASKYSKKVSYSIRTTESGFQEKEYTVEIIGLKDPVHQNMMNGMKDVIADLVAQENSAYGNPVSISKGIQKDSDTGTVNILFSTDKSKNQDATLLYTITKTNVNSYFDYQVVMERKRKGPHPRVAYAQLLNDWESNINIGKTKLNAIFTETATLSVYEKSRSTSLSPNSVSLNETVIYTTDPSYNTGGNDILKRKISINVQEPVERIFRFNVPRDKERVQRLFKNTVGTLATKRINVELIKRKGSDEETFEDDAFAIATSFKPGGTNWITEKTSSIDPFNGVTNVSLTYNYFG